MSRFKPDSCSLVVASRWDQWRLGQDRKRQRRLVLDNLRPALREQVAASRW